MKKILFIFLMLVSFPMLVEIQAQSMEHLSFLGIPINGTLKNYITQLERKGFKQFVANDGTLYLDGKYLGEDVLVQVVTKRDVVGMINVISQDGYDQQNVILRMAEFEKSLSKSYGAKFISGQQGDKADVYKNGVRIGVIGVGGLPLQPGVYSPTISFIDSKNFGK